MHWLWRGLIAVTVGTILGVIAGLVCLIFYGARVVYSPLYLTGHVLILSATLIGPAVTLATYSLLSGQHLVRTESETECRCRRCEYILRGISEPRCPECGEAI